MMWVAVIACAAVASVFFFAMVSQEKICILSPILFIHIKIKCVFLFIIVNKKKLGLKVPLQAFFAVREKKRRGGRLLPGQSEVTYPCLTDGYSCTIHTMIFNGHCNNAVYPDHPPYLLLLGHSYF